MFDYVVDIRFILITVIVSLTRCFVSKKWWEKKYPPKFQLNCWMNLKSWKNVNCDETRVSSMSHKRSTSLYESHPQWLASTLNEVAITNFFLRNKQKANYSSFKFCNIHKKKDLNFCLNRRICTTIMRIQPERFLLAQKEYPNSRHTCSVYLS